MTVYTSLFLPPSIFAKGSSYNASLLGSSGNTSTLAIKCLEAVSQESPSCGPMASTTTITVGPTTFAMTSVSTGVQQTVTITEICILTPAKSTAVCNVNADTGLFAPFRIDAAQYNANILPVNITSAAGTATATSTGTSAGTTITKGKKAVALLALCVVSAIMWN